jgi:hypothetical protein
MKIQKKRYTCAIHEYIRDRIASFKNVDWSALSSNPNITFEFVKENQDKPWDWIYLSLNPNITFDIVKDNPDRQWDWTYLSMNPNITWDIVKANIGKPWNWAALSLNPNTTWDIVKDNPDKPWDWSYISRNPNMLLSVSDIASIVKNDHCVSVIQRVWRRVISDPNHLVCRRRLLREYSQCEFI